MAEGLKKVMDRLLSDQTFAEKMGQCKSPEEGYELARTIADGFTQEEFQDAMFKRFQELQRQIKESAAKAGSEELTEEEVELAVGGLKVEGILPVQLPDTSIQFVSNASWVASAS